MIIREALQTDLNQLVVLFDNYRMFYKAETDINGAFAFISERMMNNESTIFIALNDENRAVGFVQLYPLFSSTRMKRLWLLNDLFVQPASRGKGVSVALIDRCKELCRQTGSCGMMLETARNNTIANSLYVRTGFALDSNHNYYEWNVEAI